MPLPPESPDSAYRSLTYELSYNPDWEVWVVSGPAGVIGKTGTIPPTLNGRVDAKAWAADQLAQPPRRVTVYGWEPVDDFVHHYVAVTIPIEGKLPAAYEAWQSRAGEEERYRWYRDRAESLLSSITASPATPGLVLDLARTYTDLARLELDAERLRRLGRPVPVRVGARTATPDAKEGSKPAGE